MPIRPTFSVCMQICKPLALLPQQILLPDDPDLGGVDAVQPHLIFDLPDGKPGRCSMMKAESPYVPFGLVRHGEDDEHARLEPFVMKISSSR